jgi:O-antigen/teichoic acid export membrane protein
MILRSLVMKFQSSFVARRLVAAALWSGFGESSARVLFLISMVLIARMLGTEGYGEFGLVRATLNTFAVLGGLGLGLTANRYVAEHRDANKVFSGEIIASSYLLAAFSGLIAAVIVFSGAAYVAEQFLSAPELRGALQVTSVLVFLSSVNGAQIGILQGLEAYRRLAFVGLCQGLVGLLCFVAGSYYFGVSGAIGGLMAYVGTGVALSAWLIASEAARQGIRIAFRGFSDVLPVFLKFSIPAALAGIAVAPFKWIAETLLARDFGFEELGVFHASMTITNVAIVACSMLNAPLISLTANARARSSTSTISYVNLYGTWYFFLLVATPILLFPSLAAVPFGAAYRTPEFFEVTVLLLLYTGLLLYHQGIVRLVALSGSMWFAFATNLAEGFSLMAAYFFAREYGATGLAVAYVASYVIRIWISVPVLVRWKVISKELVLDKYFLATMLLVLAVVVFHMARMSWQQ